MKAAKYLVLVCAGAGLIALALIFFGHNRGRMDSCEMVMMGSTARLVTEARPDTAAIQQEVFHELRRLEKMMSKFDEESEVNFLNQLAQVKPVKASPELYAVIKKSREISELSAGAFDVTAPFAKNNASSRGNYRDIILDETAGTVYFAKKLKIDLGGIATGFAVDRGFAILKRRGIKNALLDIGGDMRVMGRPNPFRQWQIGIQNPLKLDEIISRIKLKNQAVTTSGNYIKKHIIDPQTRSLVKTNLLSVTVLAPDCTTADALATTFFVTGMEKARDILKKTPSIEAIFVIEENNQVKMQCVRSS